MIRPAVSILSLLTMTGTWAGFQPNVTPPGRVALAAALSPSGAAASAQAMATPPTPRSDAPLVAQRASFSIFVKGVRVGAEEVSVSRVDDGWVLSGSGRLEAPINYTLRQAEVRYDGELRPTLLRLVAQFRDQSIDLSTTFDGTVARNTFPYLGETKETTVDVSPDTIVLPNNYFGAYTVLAARLARSRPGDELRVYVAPQAEIPVVLNEVLDERVQTATRSFNVRRHRITFRNPGGPLDAEVETEEEGRLLRLTLPAAQIQVAREDVASVAARQQYWFREGDEDVRIRGNGFNLAATVSKPRAAGPAPTRAVRLPAVALVAGSGPVDRDEFVAGVPILGQLAGALADAGFLVVRYDKRGIGQSGGRAEAATLNDYADDLVAVVRWLADRDDVDSRTITVVGHSEGAWVGLVAASREKRIARLATIAGAGTTGAELVLEQQQHALAQMNLPEDERQRRVELQKKIHAALLEGGSWAGIPDELRKQADSPWFASLLAFDPARVMTRVRQPLLILAAERDRQVPAHHAEQLAALARARKNDPGVTVLTVPGVNHLLVPAVTGDVAEYGSLKDRTISAEVAAAIVKWIGETPRRP